MSSHKAFWLISANFRYFMKTEPVLKLLSIFHICLSDCPNEFCPVFTENKIKALAEFKPKNEKDLSIFLFYKGKFNKIYRGLHP